MAWTNPISWIPGKLYAAADFNAQVRDDFKYLKGQGGTRVFDSGIILKDLDGSPVGNILIVCKDEKVYLRDPTDASDTKLDVTAIPTGTGATQVAIGNHTH